MARRSTGTDQESVRKKIVVVGDGFCGKTSMLFAFSKDEFPETYIPTICETFVKEVEVRACRRHTYRINGKLYMSVLTSCRFGVRIVLL